MSYPAEFFTPQELHALSGSPQPKRQIAWLQDQRIAFVTSIDGRPLVYRTKLIPEPEVAQNGTPAFDFSAIHATSRKTAQRR